MKIINLPGDCSSSTKEQKNWQPKLDACKDVQHKPSEGTTIVITLQGKYSIIRIKKKTINYRSESQKWSTYIWEYLSKFWAVRSTEPSTGSSSNSSPCLMSCEIGPEWNSEPVGLKLWSIENLRIVFVIFNLFWK